MGLIKSFERKRADNGQLSIYCSSASFDDETIKGINKDGLMEGGDRSPEIADFASILNVLISYSFVVSFDNHHVLGSLCEDHFIHMDFKHSKIIITSKNAFLR